MTDDDMTMAAVLWRGGLDTKGIASHLRLDESAIYNRIDWIKRLARKYRRTPPDAPPPIGIIR